MRTGNCRKTKGRSVPVLNSIELEGVSSDSWRDAAQEALREASKTIRNIERMDVLGTSATVTDGKIAEYRTQVRLVFRVGKNTFKQTELVSRLGIKPLNETPGLEVYGNEPRV
jgi:flavin-binding protein dodecin